MRQYLACLGPYLWLVLQASSHVPRGRGYAAVEDCPVEVPKRAYKRLLLTRIGPSNRTWMTAVIEVEKGDGE